MILLIAHADDDGVPPVARRLAELGAPYVQFDPRTAPSLARVDVEHSRRGLVTRTLRFGDTTLDLSEVCAVWNRAKLRPIADAGVTPDQAWWVAENFVRVLLDLYERIDCVWMPERPSASHNPFRARKETDPAWDLLSTRHPEPSANNKHYQFDVATELGFSVPRTLVTNVPERFLAFYEECGGQVISKRAANVNASRKGEDVGLYTYPVQRRDLIDYQSVRYAAVVFQERVPKQVELRVTVVGRQVFAAEIRSQESARLQTDWRHYATYGNAQHYSPHVLPADVERRCADLVSALGLCFGALDLILTPDGDYVFLEVNLHGQYLWIEEITGMPISNAIAEFLVDASRVSA